ncbi:hypothetical protein POM88_044743 [Heracleum sosnowskyi]|uniref:CSC1/OSCA1-like cytosolic domain-containing protein n=1 Tax=Heracleum sosnowskyi TaxID=360622 RepID=A0AAD8H5Y6_9APIA|nr:hypothetical protein POM88_044743 [Heracleum sosnowskyi]
MANTDDTAIPDDKIVEFIALLLKTGNEVVEKELVESIIFSCLESTGSTLLDNLFQECGLVSKILEADKSSTVSSEANQPTLPASGRRAPRIGNLGHITQISNKLLQLGNTDSHIQAHLQVSIGCLLTPKLEQCRRKMQNKKFENLRKPEVTRPKNKPRCRGLIGAKVDTIEYYTEKIDELTTKLEAEQKVVLREKQQASAFVFFKSRLSAASAAQNLHARMVDTWTVVNAPEPRQVIWDNLTKQFMLFV